MGGGGGGGGNLINALQRWHDTYSPIKLLEDQSEMNPNHKKYLQLSIFNFPIATRREGKKKV